MRTRALTVEQIVGLLDDRFALLTGGGREALPRHQTLQATIDWSHDLLTPGEQALLRRLCVFGGSLTAEDAGSVCSFDERFAAEMPDMLASLMDKSLVMQGGLQAACRLSTARDDA